MNNMINLFDITSYYPINQLKKIKKNINYSNDLIDICIYQIIIHNDEPFLLFNLFKKNKKLIWPTIQDFSSFKIISKISKIKEFINIISSTYNKSFLEYNGSIIHNDRLMLWFRYNNLNYIEETNKNKFYWISVSEIINYKSFMNIYNIDSLITEFFFYYPEFISLKRNDNIFYEIPIIAYYSCDSNTLKYILKYGIYKQNLSCLYGSHYYFCNIGLANKFLLRNKGKGGIIRFALFLNKNNTNITSNFVNKYNWINNYDSLSIHSIYKNKKMIKYIIKDYKNIVPLTYLSC